MKNYQFRSIGFTYVEIMVVIGIITILTSFGLVGYTRFNKKQSLQQTAETVKTKIRDVENKALVGEKTLKGGICDGLPLNYWRFSVFSTTTYRINGSCGSTDTAFGQQDFVLPADLVFTSAVGTAVIFKPMAQGTTSSINIDFVIRQPTTGTISTIRVTPSGEIRIL